MARDLPAGHAPGPSDRLVGDAVVRFDRNERILHWVSAVAILLAVATGLILYVRPLAVAVGRRALVKDVHVVAGFAGVVPFVVALAGPWRAGLRRDLQRFALWHDDDLAWFRRRSRRASETGKFNGGQKLNAVLVGAAMVTMLLTGSIMRWFGPFPLSWRTGATFVHDWVSFGLWLLIPAHVVFALRTPGAIRSMWTGWQSSSAARARPRWWDTIDHTGETGASSDPGRDAGEQVPAR